MKIRAEEAIMAQRQIFVQEGQSLEAAKRRENIEAPYGRCGEYAKPAGDFPGCGKPLVDDSWYTCPNYPDCCRP